MRALIELTANEYAPLNRAKEKSSAGVSSLAPHADYTPFPSRRVPRLSRMMLRGVNGKTEWFFERKVFIFLRNNIFEGLEVGCQ